MLDFQRLGELGTRCRITGVIRHTVRATRSPAPERSTPDLHIAVLVMWEALLYILCVNKEKTSRYTVGRSTGRPLISKIGRSDLSDVFRERIAHVINLYTYGSQARTVNEISYEFIY